MGSEMCIRDRDNIEENFEDPDRLNDFLIDDKVIPINPMWND